MIKETSKTLYLVEFITHKGKKKDTSGPAVASLDGKYGILRFSSAAVKEMQAEKKFIKFYLQEDKGIIAWKFTANLTEEQLKSKKYRVLTSTNNQYKISISAIVKKLQNMKKESQAYEIKKYRSTDMFDKGEIYYYIETKKNDKANTTGESN